MSALPSQVDFDIDPPMPVSAYAQTVAGVNVGYDLVFTLTKCVLRALRLPTLELLVVGAGGGAEIERFLPENPGWNLVGVDPSADMLALARDTANRLGVQKRVDLVRGTVDDLPTERRFDAATCLYVLHFLSDEAKLELLRGIAARLRSGAPLIVVSGTRVDAGDLRDDLLGAWQQYGEAMGMPAEQMATTIRQLMAQQVEATPAENYVRLLLAAGLQRVTPMLDIMNGGIVAWIARPT
jgi:tRNA (cmo5U34)-methyltransferase